METEKTDNESQPKNIVSCPKCNSSWIADIGYDNAQCFSCDEVFRLKSKTGLESKQHIVRWRNGRRTRKVGTGMNPI